MTRFQKLLDRFLSRPKDFSYNELVRLLRGFGYIQQQGAGSRVVFTNEKLKHNIKLHKPHPGSILKMYQVDLIIRELRSNKLI